MAPAWAMATWLSAVVARLPSAQAPFSCAAALPPRTSATRGSMAPALKMALLSGLVWARLPSAQAALSCASALSLRNMPTRGSVFWMSPAHASSTSLGDILEAASDHNSANAFLSPR
eukprot:scaffold122770_cov108-Phaeocystis_antarctica.AAC.4